MRFLVLPFLPAVAAYVGEAVASLQNGSAALFGGDVLPPSCSENSWSPSNCRDPSESTCAEAAYSQTLRIINVRSGAETVVDIPAGTLPPPRTGAQLVYDSTAAVLVLDGGVTEVKGACRDSCAKCRGASRIVCTLSDVWSIELGNTSAPRQWKLLRETGGTCSGSMNSDGSVSSSAAPASATLLPISMFAAILTAFATSSL
jgi:hypothetical protein